MASSISYLLHLPPELLLEIGDFLPMDGILALKLTHPVLNSSLPALPRLKNRRLDRCARLAIERHCAPPKKHPHQLRCILCKMVYPTSMFVSSSSPACLPPAFEQNKPRPEVVELPPSFCAWHVGRLARVIPTGPGGRNEWVSDVKKMCMHGGCIEGWHDCDCKCGSCGYKMVRTYTRFLNNRSECKKFYFWRNSAVGPSEDPKEKACGRLYVQEVCRDPNEPNTVYSGATSEKLIIQLPVRYQDLTGPDCEMVRDQPRNSHPRRRRTSSISINRDRYTTAGIFLCSLP